MNALMGLMLGLLIVSAVLNWLLLVGQGALRDEVWVLRLDVHELAALLAEMALDDDGDDDDEWDEAMDALAWEPDELNGVSHG